MTSSAGGSALEACSAQLRVLLGRLQQAESAMRAEQLKKHDPSDEFAKLFERLERVELALVDRAVKPLDDKLALLVSRLASVEQAAGGQQQGAQQGSPPVKTEPTKNPRKSSRVGGVLAGDGESCCRKSKWG